MPGLTETKRLAFKKLQTLQFGTSISLDLEMYVSVRSCTGLHWRRIRTHEPAVANFDVVQIAEAAPSSTTAANPMESEVLWSLGL